MFKKEREGGIISNIPREKGDIGLLIVIVFKVWVFFTDFRLVNSKLV